MYIDGQEKFWSDYLDAHADLDLRISHLRIRTPFPRPATYMLLVRGLNTHGGFSAIFDRGDNFSDILFTFLHTKSLL